MQAASGDSAAEVLADFERRPPADAADIEAIRNQFPQLPADYLQFMEASNGGEGPVGTAGYLRLWPLEAVEQNSRDYNVENAAPHLLLFATDLGGTMYAFDLRDPPRIVSVPVPIEQEYVAPCGESFVEFLAAIAEGA